MFGPFGRMLRYLEEPVKHEYPAGTRPSPRGTLWAHAEGAAAELVGRRITSAAFGLSESNNDVQEGDVCVLGLDDGRFVTIFQAAGSTGIRVTQERPRIEYVRPDEEA